jgi:hypothetical protein
MKYQDMTEEEQRAWLEKKAAQYTRQHEWALVELFQLVIKTFDLEDALLLELP